MLPSHYLNIGWCREMLARRKWLKKELPVYHKEAVKFSFEGAIARSMWDGTITYHQSNALTLAIVRQFPKETNKNYNNINDFVIMNKKHAIRVMKHAEKKVLGSRTNATQ